MMMPVVEPQPRTDLQLGGGYTYQWECAILLALNYFFESVHYNPTLFDLIHDFLNQVAEIHLEGEDRKSGLDLEDVNLVNAGGDRRILIQVKTKKEKGKQWTLADPLLRKALYKFYASHFLTEQPEGTRFVFLTNRPFNPALEQVRSAIQEGTVDQCEQVDRLRQSLAHYAQKEKGTSIDPDRFRQMLARTALVEYLAVDEVKANVQAKLQAHGRRDWEQAHALLFEHFARQSTRVGGGTVTRDSVIEVLGPPPEVARPPAVAPVLGGPKWLRRVVSWVRQNALLTVLGFIAFVVFPTAWIVATEVLPMLGPASPMDGVWNIAVAGFTSVGDESIKRADADLISMVFYNQLDLEVRDLSDELKIPIQLWGPDETGVVTGDTLEERESNAEELARSIKAHMIVYGTVQRDGDFLQLQPEFYVRLEDSYEAEELVGQHAFGGNIPIIGSSENLPSQISLNLELSRRAQALALITRGLTYYSIHRYEDALEWFGKAQDKEDYWTQSDEGREVVYQFQGNAAGALLELPEAEEAYQAALEIEPEYARAYAGLGGIYYLRSLESVTDEAFKPDMELLDRAIECFEQALEAEVQSASADIPAKVAFGLGQIYTAQWFAGYDTLVQAREQFELVIEVYAEGDELEAARLQGFASEAHARLGLIERRLGNAEAAVQRYSTARELATNASRTGLFSARLADIYDSMGQTAEAESANRKAIEDYTSALGLVYSKELKAEYWAAIATRHKRLGEIDEAVDALERALDLLPQDSEKRELYQSRLDELS